MTGQLINYACQRCGRHRQTSAPDEPAMCPACELAIRLDVPVRRALADMFRHCADDSCVDLVGPGETTCLRHR